MYCLVGLQQQEQLNCSCCTQSKDFFFYPSSLVCPFIALETVRPKALKESAPVEHMSRAAQGCEKTNIASTPDWFKCRKPLKTSTPIASLLPTCPGGVGKM